MLMFCFAVFAISVLGAVGCKIADGHTVAIIEEVEEIVLPENRCDAAHCYCEGTIQTIQIDGTPRLVCPGDYDLGVRRGHLLPTL